jgi:hypothetical protein
MNTTDKGFKDAIQRKEYDLTNSKYYRIGYIIALGRMRNRASMKDYWKAFERQPDKF